MDPRQLQQWDIKKFSAILKILNNISNKLESTIYTLVTLEGISME